MESAVYRGWVRHRRMAPRRHAFRSSLYMLYLDLDELDTVFADRVLWSVERANVAAFHRADYLGDARVPLADAVRAVVHEATGRTPAGPVRMLTQLRCFGYCFNPVTFYYCFEPDGRTLDAVVAEITNTPWGERHRYVVSADDAPGAGSSVLRRRFDKAFHVSPFMGLDQRYDWSFTVPGRELLVHMENEEGGETVFDATLRMSRRPITGRTLAGCLLRHPWMTGKATAAIYLHAGLLWCKGTPFVPHPKSSGVARP